MQKVILLLVAIFMCISCTKVVYDESSSALNVVEDGSEQQDSSPIETIKEESPQEETPLEETTKEEISQDESSQEEIIPVVPAVPPVPPVDNTRKDIILTATPTEEGVLLEWNRYNGEFVSYKVSRSVETSTPQYPRANLLKTIGDVNTTSYLDTKPEGGVSYYVVTALAPFNEKTHSSVETITFPDPKETPDQNITLKGRLTSKGEVLLSWDKYEGDLLYYKIVRTIKHPNPKYPDDDVIATIGFANTTEYLDYRAKPGDNYYGVTIVRPDKSKFTSERALVIVS